MAPRQRFAPQAMGSRAGGTGTDALVGITPHTSLGPTFWETSPPVSRATTTAGLHDRCRAKTRPVRRVGADLSFQVWSAVIALRTAVRVCQGSAGSSVAAI